MLLRVQRRMFNCSVVTVEVAVVDGLGTVSYSLLVDIFTR
jgi:hypothetical protein